MEAQSAEITDLTVNHIFTTRNKFSLINIFISLFVLIHVYIFICEEDSRSPRILKTKNILQRKLSESDYNTKVNQFFQKIRINSYKGTWASKTPLLEFIKQDGVIDLFQMYRILNLFKNDTSIILGTRILDGQFIDNWYYFRLATEFEDDSNQLFDFEKNTFVGKNFTINIIKGELFDKINHPVQCAASYNFHWFSSETIETIMGSITTEDQCSLKININFEVKLVDSVKENILLSIYSISVSLLCVSQIFSAVWLNNQISNNHHNSQAISLFTVGQNVIWNAYGCLCHFFLAVSYENFTLHFGIPSLLFFTNFSIFELRLLYNLWKNQNLSSLVDINVIRQKLIKFYAMFYILLFISLFFVMKFYFIPEYILFAVIATWLPQIIHNSVFRNQTCLPVINILLNTLNKIAIPFYFKGYSQNIFNVSTDINLLIICSCIIFAELLIIFLQSICGPRFFIPWKLSINKHQFYMTKDELIAINPDWNFSECAICLLPLFSEDVEDYFFEHKRDNISTLFCRKVFNIMFNFYEYRVIKKKQFLLTPCQHPFHSKCLESWLKEKRECPTDRTAIPIIEF